MTSKPSLTSLPTVSGTSPTLRSPSVTSRGIPTFTRQIITSDSDLRSRGPTVTNNIPFCNRNVTYEVFEKRVISPDTVSILRPTKGKNIVSLQTCTLPDYSHRLIVQGELKDKK
ncbi:MAG: sortase [Rubrobacteraceae bacterium]|nr:sortase [Rubrobacteraceae bacterium]